jgi:methionyl-tRNA synthetase
MIVCPVCEHQQAAGEECEQCGKKLVVGRALAAVPVQALPELEQTVHTGPLNVVAQPMPELEATKLASPAQVPAERMQELEVNQVVRPGLAVQIDKMTELDTGREADDGQKTAAPSGAVGCRYCGNVQAEGLMCDRCGMRLPRTPAAAVAGSPVAKKFKETVWVRCKKCAAKAKAGERCGDCGQEVPLSDN